jgi:hypothetical protein
MQSVELCKHSPCESTPYFVPLQDGRIDMASMPPEIGNDHVSQIKVPAGFAVEWCEHSNFGGQCWMNGHPTSNIVLDLNSYLTNQVSSFKARAVSGKVKLFQHYDTTVGGSFECIHGSWPSMPAVIGNDQLSKVYIPKGYVVTFYRHVNYEDSMGTYKYPTNTMLSFIYGNDSVSSFKVLYDWS